MLNGKLPSALVFAILTLLAVGATSYRWVQLSTRSANWVQHSHEVLETVQHLALAVERVAANARGYGLSGDRDFLASTPDNLQDIAERRRAMRQLTRDNEPQQKQAELVDELAALTLARAASLVSLRDGGGTAAAQSAADGQDPRLSLRFQAATRQFETQEQGLLALRNGDTDQRLRETKILLAAGTLLGLLMTGAAGWRAQREASARGRAESSLHDSETKYRKLLDGVQDHSILALDPEGRVVGWGTDAEVSDVKYRGLLEAAPDAMVVVDQLGKIVLLNVETETQFGYRRDELVGREVTTIIPEGFAERLVADALRSAEDALAQRIGTGIELSGRRKDGTAFPIEIMLSPLETAGGLLVTAAIRNITARKTADADLLKNVEELKRSNADLAQFAYLASHDLQEPLRMVASYTQLLSRRYTGKLDADADEFIAYAVDGANRMQRLIQGLLEYSRVDTKGKMLCGIAAESVLCQAQLNLGVAIKERGALITHDPLPVVMGDELQLIQVFQNLLGNAIKYQTAGIPRIHVSAVEADGLVVFSIKDNGLGIEPQYFERIFGMFQRLHKREAFEGTGIGLAICKKIVERHGGSIAVASRPGHGSTFSFSLRNGVLPSSLLQEVA